MRTSITFCNKKRKDWYITSPFVGEIYVELGDSYEFDINGKEVFDKTHEAEDNNLRSSWYFDGNLIAEIVDDVLRFKSDSRDLSENLKKFIEKIGETQSFAYFVLTN